MSEYLKMKADVDDYIKFYNTKKTIYKLEMTTAELEEKTALKELCKRKGTASHLHTCTYRQLKLRQYSYSATSHIRLHIQ